MKRYMLYMSLWVTGCLLADRLPEDRMVVVQVQEDPKDISELVNKIIAKEKELHSVRFSDAEVTEAILRLFEKQGITLASFSEARVGGRKIIDGLYLIVNDKMSPDEAYKKQDMASVGITPENWSYYVKTHASLPKIQSLEKILPDSMEKVIESGKESTRRLLEHWLLCEKVQIDFDKRFPDEKGLSPEQKNEKWWKFTLKKYRLDAKTEELVLSQIPDCNIFPVDDVKLMQEIFKDKLKKSGSL